MSLRDRQQMTVLGTGLIGASLSAAARRTRQWTVIGYDADPQVLREAQGRGYIDRPIPDLEDALRGAALIVIATPVQAGLELLRTLAPLVEPGTIVTDVLSTKQSICRLADEVLPDHASFVGGHPMAGSDRSGPAAARLDLFQGRRCYIVPGKDDRANTTISDLWRVWGAKVEQIDARTHDTVVAAASHFPQILASALAGMLSDDEMNAGGNGLRDMVRIAGSDPGMWVDILLDNRPAILTAMDRMDQRLSTLRQALDAGSGAEVEAFLADGVARMRGSEGAA